MWLALLACSAEAPLTGSVTAVLNPANPHAALVSVDLDHAADVWVEHDGKVTPITRLETGEVQVLGLGADRGHTLVVHATDGESAWASEPLVVRTPPLPEGFPSCSATSYVPAAEHDEEEVYCTNGIIGEDAFVYFCVDHTGEVVHQLASPPAEALLAVTPLADGGWAGVSNARSLLVLYDARGEVTASYDSAWFEGRTTWVHHYIDMHEVLQLEAGPWAGAIAFLTDIQEDVPGFGPIYGQGIVVFDPVTETVLWDWSMMGDIGDGVPGDPLLDYTRTSSGGLQFDFAHGNDLVHHADAEGGQTFWMSLREQDWIIAIDVEAAAIRWRLGYDGDFPLVQSLAGTTERSSADWFYAQHAVVWRTHEDARTTFTVFDNGVGRRGADGGSEPGGEYSRVVEYTLDETLGRVEMGDAYGPSDPEDPGSFHTPRMGAGAVLPDGRRLALVSGIDTNPGWDGPFIREVGWPDGELRWSLDCADFGDGFYRFLWFPSIYER